MMFTKVFLTPEDQRILDPFGYNRETMARFSHESFNPMNPDYGSRTRSDYLDRYVTLADKLYSPRHAAYWSYDSEMRSKYGPQGGTFSLRLIEEHYKVSYTLAERRVQMLSPLLLGRNYLIRLIGHMREKVGDPSAYEANRYRTNGAIPTGLPKMSFDAETMIAGGSFKHLLPNLPGVRRQRGKNRVINQDATQNVRYIEKTLHACRVWLKTHLPMYFGAWLRHDKVIKRLMTEMIDCHFSTGETDFTAEDDHFGEEVLLQIVAPVYEALLPEGEYLHLAQYFTECMHQPIYMGEYMLLGKHNLFSGQPITNDVETIFGVCLILGCALELGIPLEHLRLMVLGDDITFGIAPKYKKLLIPMLELVIQVSEAAGLDMSKEKCRAECSDIRFCRVVYYAGGRRFISADGSNLLYGAYPAVLALNSIINPESTLATPGMRTMALLSICDNVWGAPHYNPFVQLIGSLRAKDAWVIPTKEDEERYADKDWWFRVYGERFNPSSSPSFQILRKSNLM